MNSLSQSARGAVVLAACLAALSTAASAQTNLVANGGFESGAFAPWATSGLSFFSGVDAMAAHSGSFGAYIGETGSLSQVLATTAGPLYELSFWMRSDGLLPNALTVQWGSTAVYAAGNVPLQSYTQVVIGGLTASSPLTALNFSFSTSLGTLELDDVSVTAVPEAPTWALTALGMAVLLGRRWRRAGLYRATQSSRLRRE